MEKLITLCMIIKNEEAVLARCLESVKNIVDEIVIVDTGSTDQTKTIAQQYTDLVFDFPWSNDFSVAKNDAISKATAPWILVLDADEYLQHDGPDIRNFLRGLDPQKPLGVISSIINYVGHPNSGKMVESSAARIFPRNPNIYFVRPIHEQLRYRHGELTYINGPLVIYHTGYTQDTIQLKNKTERNLSIFQTMQHTGNLKPYDYYTLGNEYMMAEQYELALKQYQKAYVKEEFEKYWFPYCATQMITAYLKLKQYKEASLLIDSSWRFWPQYSDFYWFKGAILYDLGLYDAAITELQMAITLSDTQDVQSADNQPWLISPNYGTSLPYQRLAVIHLDHLRIREAVYCLTKLLYSNPNNETVLFRILQLMSQSESPDSIISFLDKVYDAPKEHHLLMLLRVTMNLGNLPLYHYYKEECLKKGIPLPIHLQLLQALVLDRQDLFVSLIESCSPLPDDIELMTTICSASMVWEESSFPALIPQSNKTSELKFILDHYWGVSPESSLSQKDIAVLTKLLTQLFQLGFFDTYDRLIESFNIYADELANELGHYFYSVQQIELAINYYSILINKNKLSGKGYENLAKLYILQGEYEEALYFIKQALQLIAVPPSLYFMFLQHCEDCKLNTQIRELLRMKHSELLDIPLLKPYIN
ncbi:tetratricopeptide repeat-containing glycosyltransferase family 2 protein [Paenibacillus oleatilyticus]|uniref:tetratricopeptide repeat-containing glycosyltransferase family 2 protein n=1 Tax=Paenibacillus oleatilyticus TaxID=2594886 RepID=UPI001C1FB151|nr:glycosyltransferase [Paenibacillus oleatilyticus]MBU7317607.1 glycosyltransferase [Paenibacillus oleatilyticus]